MVNGNIIKVNCVKFVNHQQQQKKKNSESSPVPVPVPAGLAPFIIIDESTIPNIESEKW